MYASGRWSHLAKIDMVFFFKLHRNLFNPHATCDNAPKNLELILNSNELQILKHDDHSSNNRTIISSSYFLPWMHFSLLLWCSSNYCEIQTEPSANKQSLSFAARSVMMSTFPNHLNLSVNSTELLLGTQAMQVIS